MAPDVDPLTDVTDPLFALDPNEFVGARNDLAKSLRKGGDRELAARVAELRRPSPAAWAVNQLARTRREDLEQLVGLGRALREAQDQALGGADAQLLRQAGRARRDAVVALADAAVDLLAERGSGADAHTGEITATLEAASLDPEAGRLVLAGRLTAALEPPSGFGGDGGVATQPPPSRKKAPKVEPAEADHDRAARRAKAERALADARALAAEKAEAAAVAMAAADAVESRLAGAMAEVARLERELAGAREAVDRLMGDRDAAQTAAARAGDVASDARQRVEDAEGRVQALG